MDLVAAKKAKNLLEEIERIDDFFKAQALSVVPTIEARWCERIGIFNQDKELSIPSIVWTKINEFLREYQEGLKKQLEEL